jgi:hypothetical protein
MLGMKIGEGNFGEVYKGTLSGRLNSETGKKKTYTVAIKTLKLKDETEQLGERSSIKKRGVRNE